MRITDVKIVRAPHRWKTRIYVALKSSNNIWGFGEASVGQVAGAVVGALYDFRSQVMGMEVSDISKLSMYVNRDVYADGGQVTRAALAGYEMALWDILGKSYETPLYKLLGGLSEGKKTAYANGWYRGERNVESYASQAKEIVASGFRAMKIDPFGPGWRSLGKFEMDFAIDILKAVRAAIGSDTSLIVEGHSRFDVSTALELSRRMEPLNITWFEEPIAYHDLDGYRMLISRADVPIATGESYWRVDQFALLLEKARPAVVQFDPTHVGGIQASKIICEMALSANCTVAPHSASGPVNEAACAHLAAVAPHNFFFEAFPKIGPREPSDRVFTSPVEVLNGDLILHDLPGTGCSADVQALSALHSDEIAPDQNLFVKGWERREANV